MSNNTNSSVLYPNTSQILKPSTTYTIMYEIKATNSFTVPVNVPLSMFRLTFKLSDGTYNSGGIYGFTGELTTSYQKVIDTFTTTSNITGDYQIEIRNAFHDAIYNLVENTLYVRNLLILEGDHTTNPKYVKSNNGNYVDLTVSNDMSSVVEIEGRTMVNVCDQKDPIAITKSYTVENSGNHIALQGEYDGKCRPVIQGNTMVNLVKDGGQQHDNKTWVTPYLMQHAKENTDYTVIFELLNVVNNDNIPNFNCSIENSANTQLSTVEFVNGVHVVKMKTRTSDDAKSPLDTTKSVYFNGWIPNGTTSSYSIRNIMLFEGDLTQTPELIPTEYVEGLKSSFEDGYIPESMVNDNRYRCVLALAKPDGVTPFEEMYPLADGNRVRSDLIEVKPNTTYTVSSSGYVVTVHEYNSDKIWIKDHFWQDTDTYTFSTRSDCTGLVVYIKKTALLRS